MSSQKVRLAPPALWGVVLSAMVVLLSACSTTPPAALRGSGDLGVVIERADGNVKVIETTGRSVLETVGGLGDLSHASVVFSRDGRYAYVFGRDGGLTKVDLLERRIAKRVVQAGNAIGGSISHDNYVLCQKNKQLQNVHLKLNNLKLSRYYFLTFQTPSYKTLDCQMN